MPPAGLICWFTCIYSEVITLIQKFFNHITPLRPMICYLTAQQITFSIQVTSNYVLCTQATKSGFICLFVLNGAEAQAQPGIVSRGAHQKCLIPYSALPSPKHLTEWQTQPICPRQWKIVSVSSRGCRIWDINAKYFIK